MEPASISAVSAGVGAAGSLISGFSQNAQANKQAAINEANAKIAEDQANADAAAIANKAANVRGAQRAASGASGIQGSGFADAIADSDIEAKLDEQTAIYNGRLQARNYRAAAAAARSTGSGALMSGVMGAGTQALSGYGNWKWLSAHPSYPALNPTGTSTDG
jgi:hypothetical protein